MRKLLGMTLMFAGMSVMAAASDLCRYFPELPACKSGTGTKNETPEISADQIGGALALVSGSLLVLRGRRKKVQAQ